MDSKRNIRPTRLLEKLEIARPGGETPDLLRSESGHGNPENLRRAFTPEGPFSIFGCPLSTQQIRLTQEQITRVNAGTGTGNESWFSSGENPMERQPETGKLEAHNLKVIGSNPIPATIFPGE
jgi:hypothetical protein